jgi:hypothetical protein
MNSERAQSSGQSRAGLGWCLFWCRALSASVEVFLHQPRSFGERYLGLQAGAAMLLLLLYPAFWQGHDIEPLFVFLGAFVVMCACVGARVSERRRNGGPQPHTFYAGRPHLMRLAGRIDEAKVKSVIEPVLVLVVGGLIKNVNEPLGSYLLFAGVGLLISVNAMLAYERKRALDMHDAFMDQRNIAERFRDMRDR